MWNTWRKKKHFTFFNMYINLFAFLDGFNSYITFDLVKKFFSILEVIILAGIGAANDHYYKIFIVEIYLFIANRWFQQMAVFINPFFQVQRSCYHDSAFF